MPDEQARYRTRPDDHNPAMPPGIPFIVANEAAERFSFYGMKAILFVFLTEHLRSETGNPEPMDPTVATVWTHNFVKAAYFFPLLGAVASDWLLGKYRTILSLSLLYCVGHAVMALVDIPGLTGLAPRVSLWWALALIALSTGGIKPCVSAHVGDQFGRGNARLMSRVYTWFYFAINLGATASTLLTPWLLGRFGPAVAFGVPGVLMGMATLVFWLGRDRFVHVPPAGRRFWTEATTADGLRPLARLLPLFLLLSVFWCLFDQTTSAWVEQCKHMDRTVSLGPLGAWTIDAAQVQAANPILVMLLIPLLTQLVYPWCEGRWSLTPLRRIGLGMFLGAPAFAIVACIQAGIDRGETPHVGWQGLAYLVITTAEVLLSVTALEFAYTQAPPQLKSLVTGVYWSSVYLGNELTVRVNEHILARRKAGEAVLEGAAYFWFFTALMVVAALAYALWSRTYRGRVYLQGDGPPGDAPQAA